MNYAFLDIAHEFNLDVINKFIDNNNISVSFMNTPNKGMFHGDNEKCQYYISEIKKNNPELIHWDLNDYLYTEDYFNFINVPWVIEEDDIVKSKHIESMAMRLMDRSALISISAFSRRRLYLILLNYFNYIIKEKKIEGVVSFDTAHGFFTYIFHEVCKLRNVKIVQVEFHFLTEYSLVFNKYENPLLPNNFAEDLTLDNIKSKLPDELIKAVSTESKYLLQYKTKETKKIVKQSVFSSLLLYKRYVVKALMNLTMGVFPFLFKKRILHFASLNGIRNEFYYRLVLNRMLFKLIKLNVHYNKIASKNLDLNENYVFVGLHMQPEKTSQPMGGEYDNQLMMIKIIADSIPNGWKVYVKEHPNQFNVRKVPNRHYRDKLFYDILEKMENVELVPLQIDSNELIKNSKMVATLTGTLGWEALTSHIPVLVFGKSYYRCKAARPINSVKSCKKAIEEMLQMDNDEIEREVFRSLLYLQENNYLVKSVRWTTSFKLSSLPYEKQIENLYLKIQDFHKLNLSSNA